MPPPEITSPAAARAGHRSVTAVVVPCYNEADRLNADAFLSFARENAWVRFVFVNDGSRDATPALLERIRATCPEQVWVIDRKQNRGKGESVREGMEFARREADVAVIGFWDADLATPFSELPGMLAVLEEKPDLELVMAARVSLLGRSIRRKMYRHYIGRVFATAVSNILRLPVYDTQCGAKLFRNTPRLGRYLAEPFLSRWIFDVELLARMVEAADGNRERILQSVYEYPIMAWEDVGGSKLRPRDFLRAFVDLAHIRNRYRL